MGLNNNNNLKFIFKLFLIVCLSHSYALTTKVPAQFSRNSSLLIMNANNGKIIYSYKANTPRLIASNMKLITTAVALNTLGPDFHWQTQVAYTGSIKNDTLDGDLYIIGGGDPTFDSRALNEILMHIAPIKNINGNIVVDNYIFNQLPSYSMLKIDKYDFDTVLPNGFIVDANKTIFNFTIKNNRAIISSNLYGYKIINNLKVNHRINHCGSLVNLLQYKNNEIEFNGSIAPQCNNVKLELNMLPYDKYTTMAIESSLNNLSLKLHGTIVFAKSPASIKILYNYKSQALEDALIYMNHYSVNLIAMTTMLSIGTFKQNSQDNYFTAQQIFHTYLEQNHLLNPKFYLENGAGLSRKEFVTATNMANLLFLVGNSAQNHNFEKTLPQSSESGTLENNFRTFGSRAHFKTGTLNDTRAYSGYYYSRKGNKYIVVAIANNINTTNPKVIINLDRWIASILKTLK
ncbi:MAG: D-alanyl-D-alanine carboxypeptidase/D-alanyl-D-alanine-endopeptidase [Pseudomonadota bacterium]|nr:D-alanyl-D-alanine carboxypeptidase/D-alanyl-D-alanine-endopeptidase [Burkholderiales bacterium]